MSESASNFIIQKINKDIENNKHDGKVVTRFPPEPNGFLHIGHAKSICLNFGLAQTYQGQCNLRFDDTNPVNEDVMFTESIQEDIRWLGFEWGALHHASDYYEKLFAFAVKLIEQGKAYVCDLSPEQAREYRGTLTTPGKDSPFRERSVEENLALFHQMREGAFEDGHCVLRAKIDMSSPNMNMRDPMMYRIKHATHHQTGDAWCIYPLYDFAHPLSDALEHVTHSLCSLEFEDHRPLYEWFIESLGLSPRPEQTEFARLHLEYTVMSKRKLKQLVEDNHVTGWDDPRMPTISGLRRRGYTPSSIRDFCDRIGVSRSASVVEMGTLEFAIREDLNQQAHRVMAVFEPLKVVVVNYPEGQTEQLDIANHPQRPELGTRQVPFSKELYIERSDFSLEPPRKYKRLKEGGNVRLKGAYIVDLVDIIKNDEGEVVELHVTYDPETKSGSGTSERKTKGVIHWVEANQCVDVTVRQYDRLFKVPEPARTEEGKSFVDHLNQDSLATIEGVLCEPGVAEFAPETRVQFERTGYFVTDRYDHSDQKPVFNRTVTLRDTWSEQTKA